MNERIKSRTEQVVQGRIGEEVPDAIRRLYGKGLSQDQVAQFLGVHRATLGRWMKEWRIPTRDRRAVPERVA